MNRIASILENLFGVVADNAMDFVRSMGFIRFWEEEPDENGEMGTESNWSMLRRALSRLFWIIAILSILIMLIGFFGPQSLGKIVVVFLLGIPLLFVLGRLWAAGFVTLALVAPGIPGTQLKPFTHGVMHGALGLTLGAFLMAFVPYSEAPWALIFSIMLGIAGSIAAYLEYTKFAKWSFVAIAAIALLLAIVPRDVREAVGGWSDRNRRDLVEDINCWNNDDPRCLKDVKRVKKQGSPHVDASALWPTGKGKYRRGTVTSDEKVFRPGVFSEVRFNAADADLDRILIRDCDEPKITRTLAEWRRVRDKDPASCLDPWVRVETKQGVQDTLSLYFMQVK